MQKAWHPTRDELISIEKYEREALRQGYKDSNAAPPARCPVCVGLMRLRAGQNQQANRHFYHAEQNFCPTKETAAEPYSALPPGRLDKEAAVRNRQFAETHVGQIFRRMKEFIPHFSFLEYLDLLRKAKDLEVYAYVNLRPEQLPYIYATLHNFPRRRAVGRTEARPFGVRFYYQSSTPPDEELWIERGMNAKLIRFIDRPGTEADDVAVIERSLDYLRAVPWLSTRQIKWCLDVM